MITFFAQVPQIAAACNVQPPIYLIKEFDNSVIFPNEGSRKFKLATIVTGATYEVQGNVVSQGSLESQGTLQTNSSPMLSQAMTPYSTHQMPKRPLSIPVQHSLMPHVRRRIIQKTIIVALRDATKPSSSRANRLTHTIITSVIVKLDHAWENVMLQLLLKR